MLEVCRSMLLLTQDESLAERFASQAKDLNVPLFVRKKWKGSFRITQDVVVAEESFIPFIHFEDRHKLILITNNVSGNMMEADRFIFNRENENEIRYAFMKKSPEVKKQKRLSSIIKKAGSSFCSGKDFSFDFAQRDYKYKGKSIYMSEAQATSVAEWLLLGRKNHLLHAHLYNLRKKFGQKFLALESRKRREYYV